MFFFNETESILSTILSVLPQYYYLVATVNDGLHVSTQWRNAYVSTGEAGRRDVTTVFHVSGLRIARSRLKNDTPLAWHEIKTQLSVVYIKLRKREVIKRALSKVNNKVTLTYLHPIINKLYCLSTQFRQSDFLRLLTTINSQSKKS